MQGTSKITVLGHLGERAFRNFKGSKQTIVGAYRRPLQFWRINLWHLN